MRFTWLVLLRGLSIGGTGVLSAKNRTRLPERPGDNAVLDCLPMKFNVNYEQ